MAYLAGLTNDDALIFFTALTDNNTLISFSSNNPDDATTVSVTGIEGTLLGIDVRPANGMIYGLTTANKLYTIDASSGAATFASTLSRPFEGGVVSGFDFNPVADRLRLVGDNDQNFRINVDTGAVLVDSTLAFGGSDANAGVNPNVTASAYTNSVATPTSTALYNIDALLNVLVLQTPPNNGTLVTVGDLGIDFDVVGGFDIVSPTEGNNLAFAVSDSMLYSIDLSTGEAIELGRIGDECGFDLLGFAALPSSRAVEMPESNSVPEAYIPGEDNLAGYYSVGSLPDMGVESASAQLEDINGIINGAYRMDESIGTSLIIDNIWQQFGLSAGDLSRIDTTLPCLDLASINDLCQAHQTGIAA